MFTMKCKCLCVCSCSILFSWDTQNPFDMRHSKKYLFIADVVLAKRLNFKRLHHINLAMWYVKLTLNYTYIIFVFVRDRDRLVLVLKHSEYQSNEINVSFSRRTNLMHNVDNLTAIYSVLNRVSHILHEHMKYIPYIGISHPHVIQHSSYKNNLKRNTAFIQFFVSVFPLLSRTRFYSFQLIRIQWKWKNNRTRWFVN